LLKANLHLRERGDFFVLTKKAMWMRKASFRRPAGGKAADTLVPKRGEAATGKMPWPEAAAQSGTEAESLPAGRQATWRKILRSRRFWRGEQNFLTTYFLLLFTKVKRSPASQNLRNK